MLHNDNRTLLGALGRHAVHPFPARMAPEIVCSFMRRAGRPLRVVDPMMGSGTVIALAQSMNHRAIGIDIDPLAVLIGRVWTSPVNAEDVRRKAQRIFHRASRLALQLRGAETYPPSADDETKKFIRYWFDCKARRQLAALSRTISRVRDERTRNVLWCAMSRLIIAKRGASRALDLVHSRPHRYFERAPVAPLSKFLASVDFVIGSTPDKHGERGERRWRHARIHRGDARKLNIPAGTVDLVLTSPPYLNAIDYMRCSKFSLVWMGFNVRQLTAIRASSVGTEVGGRTAHDNGIMDIMQRMKLLGLPKRQQSIVAAYINDMRAAIGEVARILAPGGRALYVVGENTVRGVYIRNAKILALLAKQVGMKVEWRRCRPLPPTRRYLPPPTRVADTMNVRMRTEIVLSLKKRRM
jgi:SAM-dependent methyltransferase